MLRDPLIAAIRTGVATVVGFVVTYLISKGWGLPSDFTANLNLVLIAFVTAGYNWAVIMLERHVHPYFGVLLGVPRTPVYEDQK